MGPCLVIIKGLRISFSILPCTLIFVQSLRVSGKIANDQVACHENCDPSKQFGHSFHG